MQVLEQHKSLYKHSLQQRVQVLSLVALVTLPKRHNPPWHNPQQHRGLDLSRESHSFGLARNRPRERLVFQFQPR